ncbi:hypothetical protein DVK85_09905 [Flavobacterium arcticum]|uniref:Uncharacterized protein n=1 Tax=Flavobacterium arcticum TaxID=1784713 RepID=A0A345HD72_9FLAO|nr:hypothetical protein [Flavobacterium arcticum]AXG74532.1 hypothetical protein DVK85_09905 [Flavobacterium arcticum]KAF2512347.1 hypothetical protein E0W72_03755 [Flavobacterium arcticum]
MKTYTFLSLLLFITCNLLGQQISKKEYLLDENGNSISLEDFKAKLSLTYTYGIIENDTAAIAKIVLREEKGKLNQEQLKEIKSTLKALTNRSFEDDQTLVIHFFYKPDKNPNGSCIDNYTSDNKYHRFFKRNPEYIRFNITEKDYKFKSKNVSEDTTNTLYKYFLYGGKCGNYMIIKPDGSYLKHIGEYIQKEIPKKLAEDW